MQLFKLKCCHTHSNCMLDAFKPNAKPIADAKIICYADCQADCGKNIIDLFCITCGNYGRARNPKSVLCANMRVQDLGAVLVECACNTERVHEALATTLDLVPSLAYYRWGG